MNANEFAILAGKFYNGMKYRNWSLYCLLVFLVAFAGKAQKLVTNPAFQTVATGDIRVLTYNIHHANPPSKPDYIDIEAIAKVIRQQDPDVVALQEIDVYTERSGKSLHEANELGRLTGMQAYFSKGIDYAGGEYGIAILSKHPMEGMSRIELPTEEATKGEPRTLATAIINLPGSGKILFGCTHLDAQRSSTNRLLQIRKITEVLRDEKLPVILAGDLNAAPGSEVIAVFDSSFTRTCTSGCGFTIPVEKPNKTIDFISFKPNSSFKVVEHKVVDERYASDHLPVLAVLRATR